MKKKQNKQEKPTKEKEINPVGAPTKYRPEYCQGIIDFFKKEGKPLYKTTVHEGEVKRELIGNLPAFFEAFAESIGVNVDTLHEWKKKHDQFSEAYKKAKDIQKLQFFEKGLTGDMNPALTIFTMKNIFGMRDKIENKIVDEFEDLSDEELDREIEQDEKWIEKTK